MLGKLDIAEGYMLRAIEMDEASGRQAHLGYIGVMRGMLAWRSFDRGDYANARAYFAREGELADEAGDDWRIAMNLVNWGRLEWLLGEIDRAAVMLDAALRLHRQVGQRWGLAKALADRAELHFICGELDAATALLAECAPLLQDIDLPDRLAKLYSVRGLLALEQGDCRRAALMQAKALELHAQISYVDGIEDDILCAADVAVQWRRPAHVLCLLGAHAARLQRIGKIDSPLLRQKLGTLIDAARRQLDPAAADAAWACGQAMAEEEVVAYALHEVLEPINTQR
jgi:tetratricopeptide (TPR) repeat protein